MTSRHGNPADGPVLVTGGAGFIGCNLADRLATNGHHVLIFDALKRPGVARNLEWLQRRHPGLVTSVVADIRNEPVLRQAASGASAIFHLAAQVAVTTSLADPIEDFQTNVAATLSLLEIVRRRDDATPLIFASTNKVYGDLADVALERVGETWQPADPATRQHGVGETRALDFHTPYGCSKGAADQYVLDYSRSFGVMSCVLRMSCIYGPRQMGTEDQGWVAHFMTRALAGDAISVYGDGCQVRDVLHVSDAVDAYLAAWRRIEDVNGRAFNLGGGPANAVSLRQVIARIEALTGRTIRCDQHDWRPGDQRYFVADARAARTALGLPEPRDWRSGLASLHRWLTAEYAVAEPVLS